MLKRVLSCLVVLAMLAVSAPFARAEGSVKLDELKEFSIKQKIDYLETSAKTGNNIYQAFDKLVDNIIKNRTEDELIRDFGIKSKPRGVTLTKNKAKVVETKSGCCK